MGWTSSNPVPYNNQHLLFSLFLIVGVATLPLDSSCNKYLGAIAEARSLKEGPEEPVLKK